MSCSKKNTFVTPEYIDNKIIDATLFISPITDISIIQQEEIFTELGVNIFKGEFLSTFSENLKKSLLDNSTFKKIYYLNNNLQPEFKTQFLDLNERGKFNIDLPKKPLEINLSEDIFILFLQDLVISFSKNEIESSKPGKKYLITPTPGGDVILHKLKNYNYYLISQTKYAIYDNTKNKIVSYGVVSAKEEYNKSRDMERLMNGAIQGLVKDILENTPFNEI